MATALALPSSATAVDRLSGTRKTAEGGVANTDWVIVHRASGGSTTLPALPADLGAAVLPTAWSFSLATLFDAPGLGFEVVRTNPRRQRQRLSSTQGAYPKTAFDAKYVRFSN